MINSEIIKQEVFQMGADICGIASIDRFANAPKGFHPNDIYSNCKSVVVFASHFLLSSLHSNTNVPYTFVRNKIIEKIDNISLSLSDSLYSKDVISIPIPSADPYEYWDAERNHGKGILSLKHAGQLAGLGVIGKNTLLLNEKYGNMFWLGAVLLSAELEPDPIVSYEGCIDGCTLCLDACPQQALDGITINQKLCRAYMNSYHGSGGSVLTCNTCRKICPQFSGFC